MSQKIYILRHGQTDYNLRGIIQGSGVDSSLNETGRSQADRFYNAYHQVPFDKIFTSALRRTKESVQGFIDKGIPLESLSELNEISWGPYDGVLDTAEKGSYYWNMLDAWNEGDTHKCIEGGESPEIVKERIAKGWERVIENKAHEHILVCMHGRAIRILMCHITNTPLQEMDVFQHSNLGFYLIEYDGSDFTLLRRNDTEHLTS